jgi:2-polyprenyl-3-methyl-5-hydroxy-6-metoxy-1,4-benzoquinol methylase
MNRQSATSHKLVAIPTHDVSVSLPKNTKYQDRGFVIRWLIKGFMNAVLDLVGPLGAQSILDVGCGEGLLLRQLTEVWSAGELKGVDFDLELLYAAQQVAPRASYTIGDIYALPLASECFDLVLCTEVLEHLDKPQAALAEIVRASRKHCLLSVPNEPWWRLANMIRGKYVADWGNTPSHVNHWSRSAFVSLVGVYLDVKAVRQPFPWTMVLGEVPTNSR